MADEAPQHSEVPEGAAVFPLIPEELDIHPLLLAVLHAVVFFDGSDVAVVNDAAADEALQYIATYLGRLQGQELRRVREDMQVLIEYGRSEEWPTEELQFLRGFLPEFGIGDEAAS
jgi:hypothetical protein